MNLLGGLDKSEIEIERKKLETQGEEEEEDLNKNLNEEEIGEAVMKMKQKKAVGIDGIPVEAWRFGGETIKKGLTKVMKNVWKERCIPEEWKTSIIVLLQKR